MRIGDHFTWIVAGVEASSDELVQTKLLGPRHFDDAVYGRSYSDPGNCARDVLGGHRLDLNGCEAHGGAVGGGVRDALDELEELRRVDDRVRDRRSLDQVLPGDLGTEVAACGEAFGSHDRQCDVMTHACRCFSVKKVGGRCCEELQHCRVFEGGGVGHVHDHRGAHQGFSQPLSRDGVDPRVG